MGLTDMLSVSAFGAGSVYLLLLVLSEKWEFRHGSWQIRALCIYVYWIPEVQCISSIHALRNLICRLLCSFHHVGRLSFNLVDNLNGQGQPIRTTLSSDPSDGEGYQESLLGQYCPLTDYERNYLRKTSPEFDLSVLQNSKKGVETMAK